MLKNDLLRVLGCLDLQIKEVSFINNHVTRFKFYDPSSRIEVSYVNKRFYSDLHVTDSLLRKIIELENLLWNQ